jgi:1-acyl-sn-glycerol-3-phosphate acyltransferase
MKILSCIRGVRFYAIFFIDCLLIRQKIQKIPQGDDKTYTAAVQKTNKDWMEKFFPRMGINVVYHGLENLKGISQSIHIANHGSFIDIMVTQPFIPSIFKVIAAKKYASYPIFGEVYAAGSVLVDRVSDSDTSPEAQARSKASKIKAFRMMYNLMNQGISTFFYPEGTRNKTSEKLLNFEDGAFALSVALNKPIIPIAIKGAKDMLPPGCSFTPGTVHVHILKPLYPENYPQATKEEKIAAMNRVAWKNIYEKLR